MKPTFKIAGTLIVLTLISVTVPEAQAFRGRGAAFAVGAAAGSSSASGQSNAAASQQQAATAQQQAATAQQQAAIAQQQAATAQQQAGSAGAPLPLGTVVQSLPAGCAQSPVGGVQYYQCGGNTYQAVFEGSTLKYVTTKPQ